MYIPAHFEQPGIGHMQKLMRQYPLATLVTSSGSGIDANHIPLQLTETPGPYGCLQGHIARANPLCHTFDGNEVLAIFHGPNSYISPSWYATKQQTHKVVPTWNYAVVHAYGSLQFIDDAAWLRTRLEAFTSQNEAGFPKPWALSDAPHDFTERLMQSIVGIEIKITRLTGKWKLSQNQPQENQQSIISGLSESDKRDESVMAEWVKAQCSGS